MRALGWVLRFARRQRDAVDSQLASPVRALLRLAVPGLRFFGERGYQAMFGRDSGRAFGIGDRRRWHAANADSSVNVGWRCTAAAVHDPVGASPNVP